MRALPWRTLFAWLFGLGVTLVLGGYTYTLLAADPTVYAMGPKMEKCTTTGIDAPAAPQGLPIGIGAQNFYDTEPLLLSITFPDGRIYSPLVAANDDPSGSNGLNGIVDTPNDTGFAVQTNSGGDYFNLFTSTRKWPLGCYTFTVFGFTSQKQASGHFVILADTSLNANPGQTNLQAQSSTTRQAIGTQGVTVEIFGRGFLSEDTVDLALLQPDGTLITLPPPAVSTVGSFQTDVTLGVARQVGKYTFIARSSSGYGSTAQFELQARPINRKGYGTIRVADPEPNIVKQGRALQLQGKQFAPGEIVGIDLRQPNGATSTLRKESANNLGEFSVSLDLTRQHRTGTQTIIVWSDSTVVTTEVKLMAGSPVIPSAALVTPVPVNPTAINQTANPSPSVVPSGSPSPLAATSSPALITSSASPIPVTPTNDATSTTPSTVLAATVLPPSTVITATVEPGGKGGNDPAITVLPVTITPTIGGKGEAGNAASATPEPVFIPFPNLEQSEAPVVTPIAGVQETPIATPVHLPATSVGSEGHSMPPHSTPTPSF